MYKGGQNIMKNRSLTLIIMLFASAILVSCTECTAEQYEDSEGTQRITNEEHSTSTEDIHFTETTYVETTNEKTSSHEETVTTEKTTEGDISETSTSNSEEVQTDLTQQQTEVTQQEVIYEEEPTTFDVVQYDFANGFTEPIDDSILTECLVAETDATTTETIVNDYLEINDQKIKIVYGAANQENIDNNDVVQDTEYWSSAQNIYLFGHVYRSFSCLSHVRQGEIITLVNNGVESKYEVIRSEQGILTEDGFDIKSTQDGCYFIFGDFGCETIRLITCDSAFSRTRRWVVIGQKIS